MTLSFQETTAQANLIGIGGQRLAVVDVAIR
jgi:hypothetical protein